MKKRQLNRHSFLVLLTLTSGNLYSASICSRYYLPDAKVMHIENDLNLFKSLEGNPIKGDIHFQGDISIQGDLAKVFMQNETPYYYSFAGPTGIRYNNKAIYGQGADYHAHGFGNPLGELKELHINGEIISEIKSYPQLLRELKDIKAGVDIKIIYQSGVEVKGEFANLVGTTARKNAPKKGITFGNEKCEVLGPNGDVLFDKSWGTYDLIFADKIQYLVK